MKKEGDGKMNERQAPDNSLFIAPILSFLICGVSVSLW